MNTNKLNDIKDAISSIKNGEVVIVVDDESRENEGDFVCASEKISSEIINFMSKEGRGLICCSLEDKRCNQLGLELMVGKNTDIYGTSFTVSVDLIGKGVTTGISASDRSKTILGLVDIKKNPSNFSKPGHIFPLKAISGGVLRRAGHTEASVDLPKISGLFPSGVICEILNADGSMARLPDLLKVAKKFIIEAQKNKKKILIWVTGDYYYTIPQYNNIIGLFTSPYQSMQNVITIPLPVIIQDPLSILETKIIRLSEFKKKPTIGFCGHSDPNFIISSILSILD